MKMPKFKTRWILYLFLVKLNAKQISQLTGLNRNTVNRYLEEISIHLAHICDEHSPLRGEVEIGESYLGAHRIKAVQG